MNNVSELVKQVAQARQSFIAAASGLTDEQTNFKTSPDAWSINENVEHMVWANGEALTACGKPFKVLKLVN